MGMPDPQNCPLRVAILSRSTRERDCLADILESNGLFVVSDEEIHSGVDKDLADVLLVNLDDSDDDDLDNIIDETELPILFNDSTSIRKPVTAGGRAWGRRLAEKLIQTSGEEFSLEEEAAVQEPEEVYDLTIEIDEDELEVGGVVELECESEAIVEEGQVADVKPVMPYKDIPTAEIVALKKNGKLDVSANRAKRVWVLGASIGGPQAVKAFLSKLPKDLPVCFILAQHIGVGFVNLLAEQLSRVTDLRVTAPEDGMVLEKGHVVVAPVEKRMDFSERGIMTMEEIKQRSIYSPSIDDVITVVSKHYGTDANAIIFSGMGNDGTAGCHLVAQKGGMVWAQEAKSCVISSMADSVRSAEIVSLSGTPEELAENLVEYLEGEYN